MKIIHTADLHIGQVLYQRYARVNEHDHFFKQLEQWCKDEKPDALIVSGDVFDIQLVSAATKKQMTDYFVSIYKACPQMEIVIIAGNHDSASRLEAEKSIWGIAKVKIVGLNPSAEIITDTNSGWQAEYVVELENGFIVTVPFMHGVREDMAQSLLDYVEERNEAQKPVVVMAHTTVTGADVTGHDIEIGNIRTTELKSIGKGYDYLALGHIHKPQTIGHSKDCMLEDVTYPSGVARYSGSALHVSCDENYPHTVSVVEMDKHGGSVRIRQLRIDELLHFMILPEQGSFLSEKDAIDAVRDAVADGKEGYFRLRIDKQTVLSSTFTNDILTLLKDNNKFRFNPKHIWTGDSTRENNEETADVVDIATLQQMRDPLEFISLTLNQYPDLHLSLEEIGDMLAEVAKETQE